MSGNMSTNLNEVRGLVVGYADPEGEGVKGKVDAGRTMQVIDNLQSAGVSREMATAAIRAARDSGQISKAVAADLISAASIALVAAPDTTQEMRAATKETAKEQGWLADFFDVIKEFFSAGIKSTKWRNGVDDKMLDKADEAGREAAANPTIKAEIIAAGGPEKYMEAKLADIKMDKDEKQKLAKEKLISEFAGGYNFTLNGHY